MAANSAAFAPGRSLDQAFLKVHFLYELGVQRYLEPKIAFEKLRGYAGRLTRRKTSRFNQLGPAIKTAALISFLRLALYQSTDEAVELWSLRVTDVNRQSYARAFASYSESVARRDRHLLDQLDALSQASQPRGPAGAACVAAISGGGAWPAREHSRGTRARRDSSGLHVHPHSSAPCAEIAHPMCWRCERVG